jgi:hypothetical protein
MRVFRPLCMWPIPYRCALSVEAGALQASLSVVAVPPAPSVLASAPVASVTVVGVNASVQTAGTTNANAIPALVTVVALAPAASSTVEPDAIAGTVTALAVPPAPSVRVNAITATVTVVAPNATSAEALPDVYPLDLIFGEELVLDAGTSSDYPNSRYASDGVGPGKGVYGRTGRYYRNRGTKCVRQYFGTGSARSGSSYRLTRGNVGTGTRQ